MRNPLFFLLAGSLCCCYAQQKADPAPEPQVVATPPSDAGRGLVRVNAREIRHYSGTRKEPDYLVSRDNGKTWEMKMAPSGYPPNYGGIPKESPAIVRNPVTREFIRVQPIGGFVFLSRGGLDGKWMAVTNDGRLEEDWKDPEKRKNLKKLGGIMRTPIFVNKGVEKVIAVVGNSYDGKLLYIGMLVREVHVFPVIRQFLFLPALTGSPLGVAFAGSQGRLGRGASGWFCTEGGDHTVEKKNTEEDG